MARCEDSFEPHLRFNPPISIDGLEILRLFFPSLFDPSMVTQIKGLQHVDFELAILEYKKKKVPED